MAHEKKICEQEERQCLVTDKLWDSIRGAFEEGEKKILRAHVTGETVCPRGIVIDEDSLPVELKQKLLDAKSKAVHA